MLSNVEKCFYPKTPEEAIELIKDNEKETLVIAGGTTAALSHNTKIKNLIDITRMGLDSIELVDGKWVLGCNVKIQEIANHSKLAKFCQGVLSEAAKSVGSRAIRNAVTLGGNSVQAFRWSDPPVVLLALDAEFVLQSPAGTRKLGAEEFYASHPRQVLKPAEILTRIEIKTSDDNIRAAFIKYAPTAFDLAIVDVAVCLKVVDGRCEMARIAIGGTKNVPWRAHDAESILKGSKLSKKVIERAAQAAKSATQTSADVRFSKEYREQMVSVIVERAIEQAIRE
jgi:carbon-monoxide dehydrogenase medium subunit